MSTDPHDAVEFPGVIELLGLIRDLLRRPRIAERIAGQAERGDLPLPLVWLTGSAGTPRRFLDSLYRYLAGEQQPRIVHTLIDVTAHHDLHPESSHAPSLLPLLDKLSVELAADRFGSGRLTRFDHYRLASWLARQRLTVPDMKNDRADIVAKLRDWSGGTDRSALAADAADELPPGYTRLGLRLVATAGKVLNVRWVRERIPGIRGEIKWFMRHQPYMIPKHSIDFIGFAERLTVDRRDSESVPQLKKLLVHAFLEDLRRAYRRRHGRWPLRRAGLRRTTYVAALLADVTEHNAGGELLRLVNEVRNETGELDPLLVIAASDQRPRDAAEPAGTHAPALSAPAALSRWRRNLPSRRQQLASDARYLVLEIPSDHPERQGEPSAWDDRGLFRPPKAHWLARRGRLEFAVSALLVAVLVRPVAELRDNLSENCVDLPFSEGVSVTVVDVAGDPQCVGYSDSDAVVFGVTPRLTHAQQAIFQQNAVAAQAHRDDPARPYVSIVYFGALTHHRANVDTDDALAEDLEGILLRQRQQNTKSKSQPLLRVIVANGGEEMKRADFVTHELLAPLLTGDSTIMGVVGLDRTVAETERAIKEFGVLGVPAIGTPLTGSGLVDRSELYFQVVPSNNKQAELVAGYARQIGARQVIVYHPPLGARDTYVRTLFGELTRVFPANRVQRVQWHESAGDLDSLCTGLVDHGEDMVFYAGREEEFGEFLSTVTAGCEIPQLPDIVASDAISRFVAQRGNRTKPEFAGISVSYVSMGSLVVLAGRPCAEGRPGSLEGGTTLAAFCDGYRTLRAELTATLQPADRPAAPWPGERVGLTYDAAGMLVEAVRQVRRRTDVPAPHRAAVALQMREMTFKGATGLLDFRQSRIGDRRSLAILSVANIRDPRSTPECAYLIGDLYKPSQARAWNGCPLPGQ